MGESDNVVLNAIQELGSAVNASIADIKQCLAVQNAKMDDMAADITENKAKMVKMDESLRGNGKPGLEQRVCSLEDYIEARKKLEWLVLGLLVTEFFGLIVSFIFMVVSHPGMITP